MILAIDVKTKGCYSANISLLKTTLIMPEIISIPLDDDTLKEVALDLQEYTTSIQIMTPLKLDQEVKANQTKMLELQAIYDRHPEDPEEANDARRDYTIADLFQKTCIEEKTKRIFKNALQQTTT